MHDTTPPTTQSSSATQSSPKSSSSKSSSSARSSATCPCSTSAPADGRQQVQLFWHLSQALCSLCHSIPWAELSAAEKQRLTQVLKLLESDVQLARLAGLIATKRGSVKQKLLNKELLSEDLNKELANKNRLTQRDSNPHLVKSTS